MSDQTKIITTERGRFRLKLWETNKGWTLGYARWNVCASVAWESGGGQRIWFPLEHQAGDFNSWDRAERDGAAALDYWSTHFNPETWDDTPPNVDIGES